MSEDVYDDSKKGLSIASMVLGIVGIVTSCTIVGIICALLAIIFGAICVRKKEGIKGMAIAGLVLGIIAIATWVVVFLIIGGIAAIAAGTVMK